MYLSSLRRALGDALGQVLTPELAAAVEARAFSGDDHPVPVEAFEHAHVGAYVIAVERFAAVLPELLPLHAAHWQETEKHRAGLPLNPDYAAMAADDRRGDLLQFTVRRGTALVGNLRLYLRTSRHTGLRVAIEDTLYIDPAHRDGWLGIKLLRYAEQCLRQMGVREVEANSKTLNGADVLLRRLGYRQVAIQFHKILPKD